MTRSQPAPAGTAFRPLRARLAPLALAVHVAVAATLALGAAAPAQAQEARRPVRYDIPAGPLADALNRFAQQSGVAIALDAARLQSLRSPGLAGDYGVEDGFAALLHGSGHVAVRTEAGYVLRAAEPPVQGDAVLPAVKIRDSAVDDAATEGTGSYTTGRTRTATGMDLSLRQTPQSVSVLTRQRLDDQKIDDLVDIVQNTTGLSINRYESNRGTMFSRGFEIRTYMVDGVQSSTIVDERYTADEVLTGTAIYDRVEVLRGADGLMVGTGDPSAMINLVRKRADSDVFTGSLTAELGSWSHRGLMLDVNTPLSADGATRARMVFDYDDRGSHIDRLENRTVVGYLALEQDIGERTLLGVGISHQDNHTDDPTWGGVPAWVYTSDRTQAVRLELDHGLNPSADWSYWTSDFTEAFATAEHRFSDDWKASARYTWSERDSAANMAMPYSSYPVDPVAGRVALILSLNGVPVYTQFAPGYSGLYTARNEKDSMNLRVDGRFELFGRTHDVAFGYDRSVERIQAVREEVGSIAVDDIPSIFDDYRGQVVDSRNPSGVIDIDQKIEQRALYAMGRFALAEPLHLLAGARLIDYRTDNRHTPGQSIDTSDKLVPYAGLVYDLPWGLSAYASYTSIFEPQYQRDEAYNQLDPIEGNTREAGLKGEFFGGRLNAMLAVFRMEQDNMARFTRSVTRPDGSRFQAYEGVDGAVSKGVEAEISGAITPDWQVQAGYSRFKAHEANGIEVNTLIPRRQFNLFTSYRLPGALRGLTIGGGVRWQSEVWVLQSIARVLGLAATEQGSYSVASLMARYEWGGDAWSAQLNVDNVLDEDYVAPTADGMQVFRGAPRGAELTIRYRF